MVVCWGIEGRGGKRFGTFLSFFFFFSCYFSKGSTLGYRHTETVGVSNGAGSLSGEEASCQL